MCRRSAKDMKSDKTWLYSIKRCESTGRENFAIKLEVVSHKWVCNMWNKWLRLTEWERFLGINADQDSWEKFQTGLKNM